MRRNTSDIVPYVILGSAVGGAVSYLFMTESGRRLRSSITNPEGTVRGVTDQAHGVFDRAKESMEAGQQAFQEAQRNYQTHFRKIERKNAEITANLHKAVDDLSKTANELEEAILDPLYEFGALFHAIDRGVRVFCGQKGQVSPFIKNERVTV